LFCFSAERPAADAAAVSEGDIIMCGIVGYVGNESAVSFLLQGLKRLEYRGYDSAGVALLQNGKIHVEKSQGKLVRVEKLLNGHAKNYADSHCGIGHTRWATHGKPTTQNAHPHRSGHVVLVHNGIIENYQEIKKGLMARGHMPKSETDSELLGFLVLEFMDKGLGLVEATRKSFTQLEGQNSVVIMSEREPGTIVGVRNGSPLVVAENPGGGALLASDAQPLLGLSKDVIFLEHGDLVIGDAKGLRFMRMSNGKAVTRKPTRIDWSADRLDKQGYPHYMLKEIHEQPTAMVDTLNAVLDRSKAEPFTLAKHPGARLLGAAKEISIVACGTSWHAALVAKYWLEKWARIPVSVELASEFRYRDPILGKGALCISISQSGETADILAVVRQMKTAKVPVLGVTNVRGSTLSREANAVFFMAAGPEIGVAATKTFSAQLAMNLVFAGYIAQKRFGAKGRKKAGKKGAKTSQADAIQRLFDDLLRLPHLLNATLEPESPLLASVREAAKALKNAKGFFFIGRGYSFPIALEGALKLKEIAYVHAEGYAGGELKHGPIAMIDKSMVVVVLAPRDSWRDKTVSNLEEVKARGARILSIGDPSDKQLRDLSDYWIALPDGARELDESVLPLLLAPILHLFSYEFALLQGTDVDQPRNLAKSVTVE
jgi:glucosamine--fructose-6-phosphate aminotransferase (isomerizing)